MSNYCVYDGQGINGPQEEGSVFTLADQAELAAFVDKYACGDAGKLENDVRSLRNAINNTQGKGARTIKLREWLESHPLPSEADMDAFMALRDKAYKAKTASIDSDRYRTIVESAEQGLITEDKARSTVLSERVAACDRAVHAINSVIFRFGECQSLIEEYPEAVMTQEDLDSAMAAFGEFDAWERTKASFRERYEACETVAERAKLAGMFPELAAAAL